MSTLYSGKCYFCKEYVSLATNAFMGQPVCAKEECSDLLLKKVDELGLKIVKENFYPPPPIFDLWDEVQGLQPWQKQLFESVFGKPKAKIILKPSATPYSTQIHAYFHYKINGKQNYEQAWKESTIWN